MNLEPFDADEELRKKTYESLAEAEVRFFASVSRAFSRAMLRIRSELSAFGRWLALAFRAKDEGSHMEMAMHANRLVGTIFNPFRLIAMLLGGVVIILSALLAWQWPRAAILEKKLKASEERHRVAVDRSWQWKTRADAASAALVQTEKKLAEDGATRAKEAERSVQLAKSAERRAASLDRRRKERINDALRIAAGNDDLPLDLDSRLRDLASSGASANRLDDASASSGNSASGMSVGPGDASPIQPDAPPATSSGDGQDGSGSGLLAGSRTPR